MSTPTKTGGPAFPVPSPEMVIEGQTVEETQGMTLRAWFAGQALAGEMACWSDKKPEGFEDSIAARCYAIADAMIAAEGSTE